MATIFRPTWVEINIDTLKRNYSLLKKFIGNKSEIIAVVKANAYGMGLVQTVGILASEGCEKFAVATPDEAFELRGSGFNGSLLVIGPSTAISAPLYIKHDIEVTCGNDQFLHALSVAALAQKKEAMVHYKIDTGLGRSGYSPKAFFDGAEQYYATPGIKAVGILSHLAVADEGQNLYTEQQFYRFSELLDSLHAKGIDVGCRHICNSAATIAYPKMHMDAVRAGKILYGFWPAGVEKIIKPEYPFKVRSEIVSIREISAGQAFGYGLRYVSRDDDRIAVVPIGYADGYTRLYAGKTHALVRGQRTPVVASICCDQLFLRITDIPDAQIGDEVILVGKQQGEEITPDELGSLIGTSACEVVSFFRGRMPRVYVSGANGENFCAKENLLCQS